VPWLFVGAGVFLAPWTVFLAVTLAAHDTTSHFRILWVGFDVGLGAAILATGLAALRFSPWLEAAAAAAATMLVCDAWFDIWLSSDDTKELITAIVFAVVAELPMAALAFWIARDAERFVAQLERATSRVGPTEPENSTPEPD
jgi:hypothetical protein